MTVTSAMGLDDLDGAAWAGGSGETSIAGEQRHLQRLGKSDVGGVVNREVVPQLPPAGQEWGVLDAPDGQVAEIVEGQPGPPRIQVPTASQSAPNRRHFEIDQRRSGKLFAAQPEPDHVPVRAIIQQRDGQDAGISDEHGRTAKR